ncbi:hypothetical protein niasHS_008754 [Heterodera schachtii]|uniref:MATH domain-containing protein n=1 Tax=Heterodera schachtii TaxID=97005 RepID=A0ABD2JA41_HETSC
MEEVIAVLQYHCNPNLRNAPGQYPMAFPRHGRISDQNEGTLSMEIENLSEFARERVNSFRLSEGIYRKGLPWKIWAQIRQNSEGSAKYLGFYLLCTAPNEDGNWSCECSASLRIVSQKSGMKDFTRKFERILNNKVNKWGFQLITFEELMDLNNGFYDEDGDKVTLVIDFIVGKVKR